VSCLALAAASAPVALAQEGHPPISAIDVYVEMIPTSSGSVPLGALPPTLAPGSRPPAPAAPSAPLTPAATETLREQGGRDAPLLERIATAPELGAPQRVVPADLARIAEGSGAFGAVTDGSSRVPWLLAALVLITAAVAAGATRQRKRANAIPRVER
jgi:hypothetical protein